METASEDMMSLFRELLEKEEMMIKLYSGMSAKIASPEVRRVIDSIVKDERSHAENAKKMMEILEEKD